MEGLFRYFVVAIVRRRRDGQLSPPIGGVLREGGEKGDHQTHRLEGTYEKAGGWRKRKVPCNFMSSPPDQRSFVLSYLE